MIIRPKLRPKELKEFDMYFGNLRAVAKKNLDKEELENLKFSAMYSKRIYAVMHNNEKSMERARNLWDNIKQILIMIIVKDAEYALKYVLLKQ